MAVEFTKEGHVAYIKMNRPEAMNSLDLESVSRLKEIWVRVETDDDIRVAVLTGAGEKAFCTGRDMKNLPPADLPAIGEYFQERIPLIDDMKIWKPIIAAINGYAVGGGFEVALACDLRIASENAKFGLMEAARGTLAGLNGTQNLPRAIPQAVAMKMLLTGELIDAREAHRVGLISDVVKSEELEPLARRYAEKIAANAPLSVKAAKLAAVLGKDIPLEHATVFSNLIWGLLRDTHDRSEGFKAFVEKRPPRFKGRYKRSVRRPSSGKEPRRSHGRTGERSGNRPGDNDRRG